MTRLGLVAGADIDTAALESKLQAMDLAMALTSESELALNALSVKQVSPMELIPTSRLRRLAERSLSARNHFMATICNGEKLDGIDWPALFLEDNYLLFFRDLFFAQTLGRRLREEGVEDVSWETSSNGSGGGIGGIFKQALSSIEGLNVSTASASAESFRRRRIADPLKRLARRLRARSRKLPSACQVAAVFSTRQWQRFRSSLVDLKQTFGEDFQLWYLGSAEKDLVSWAKAHQIRLHCIAYPTKVEPDITQFFQGHRDRWRDQTRYQLADDLDCPAIASNQLQASMDLFLSYTLPRTAQWGRSFRHLTESVSPSLIVGSAAYTYQTALPYHVANVLGLPSVALSHTYVSGDHSPVPSTYLACRNSFERQSFRHSFPRDKKVLYCHNSSDTLSYQPDPSHRIERQKRPLVAMLTASSTFGRFLMPTLDTEEFVRTLRALANPPPELSRIDFALKSHPRFDISGPFSEATDSTNVWVVPATASITSLLETAWLIVIFNHYGGVVVDAITSGKPIVFLDSAGYFYPQVETFGFEAGEVVQTVEDFWDLLRDLSNNAEHYQALEQKCQRFASSHLKSSSDTLGDSLARLLFEEQKFG